MRGDARRWGRQTRFTGCRTVIPILGIGLILVGVLVLISFAAAGCASSAGMGKMAPDFSGKTLDGVDLSLGAYRGRPLVLAFMASW